jgi:hypothetical protein
LAEAAPARAEPARPPLLATPGAWWIGAIGIAAVAIGTAAAAAVWWGEVQADRAEARWRAEVAAVRAEPPFRRPVLPWLKPRPGDAAARYRAIFATWQAPTQLGGALQAYEQANSSGCAPTLTALSAPLEAWLDQQGPLLFDALEDALAMESAGWWCDLSVDPGQSTVEAAKILAVRLFLADSRRLAARGDARGAIRRVAAGAAIEDDFARGGSNGWLYPILGIRTLEHADIDVAREALAAAKVLVQTRPPVSALLRAERLVRGARALGLMGRLDPAPFTHWPAGPLRSGLKLGWAGLEAGAAEGEPIIEAHPWPEAGPLLERVEQRERQGAGMLVFDYYIVPHPHGTALEQLAILGRRRQALIAAAVRLFRMENGALPGKLEDLVPRYLDAVPLDPVSNAPFSPSTFEVAPPR